MKSDKSKLQEKKSRAEKAAAKKARLAKSLRQNLGKRKRQVQKRKESAFKNT